MENNIIRIYWYKPMLMEDAIRNELSYEQGLYYITRLWGNKETSLYIGKASCSNTIRQRLRAHRDHWLTEYHGKIYVRIGHVIYPRKMAIEYEAEVIDHAESALLYDKSHKNLFNENINKRKSYSYTSLHRVENLGDKFELSPMVKMDLQE